jgi:hypothetical protein
MMQNYEWIVYKNKKVLYVILAGQSVDEIKEIIERTKPVIAQEPPKSILCLTDVTNLKTNPEITQMIKDYTKHNEPYIRVTALTGVEGIKQVIFNGVLLFTRRKNMVLKDTKEEALDWLVNQ